MSTQIKCAIDIKLFSNKKKGRTDNCYNMDKSENITEKRAASVFGQEVMMPPSKNTPGEIKTNEYDYWIGIVI
jgi:hypothetical protein